MSATKLIRFLRGGQLPYVTGDKVLINSGAADLLIARGIAEPYSFTAEEIARGEADRKAAEAAQAEAAEMTRNFLAQRMMHAAAEKPGAGYRTK